MMGGAERSIARSERNTLPPPDGLWGGELLLCSYPSCLFFYFENLSINQGQFYLLLPKMSNKHKEKETNFEYLEKVVEEEQETNALVSLTNDTVLRRQVQWDAMQRAKLITEREYEMIMRFDKKPLQEREALLDAVSPPPQPLIQN